MGNIAQKLKGQYKIFIGGLNSSGKTTILYHLKLGKFLQTTPTIGFNVQTIQVNNKKLTLYDVGGGYMIRPLFQHYFEDLYGLIYVISTKDVGNLQNSMKDLWQFHLKYIDVKIPILFYINKGQNSQFDIKFVQAYIRQAVKGRDIIIKQCVATKGQGLLQGITQLSNKIKFKNSLKK